MYTLVEIFDAKQYENILGVDMWDRDFGGITLESYLKEVEESIEEKNKKLEQIEESNLEQKKKEELEQIDYQRILYKLWQT